MSKTEEQMAELLSQLKSLVLKNRKEFDSKDLPFILSRLKQLQDLVEELNSEELSKD